MTQFPHLFAPVSLRGRALASRVTFGAHTANMAVDGLPTAQHRGYYAERARGGAGMVVVEPVPVHRTAVLTRGNFRSDDDSVVPAFAELVREVRAANPAVVLIQQLYHVGQHGDADNSYAPSWSPSGLPSYHDGDGSHAITAAEIEELTGAFVRAAVRARAAGFDGIELFAAYHSLVDQFWTPWSNRRDDAWGGTFENRLRFGADVLAGIRSACGDGFVVGMAVSMALGGSPHGSEPGPALSIAELAEVVRWHDERRLVDYVSCGTGNYFDFAGIIPPSLYEQRLGEPFAAELKKVVTHALVQCESHVRTPEAAEAVLAAGHADLVSVVRGQIADPHLVAKARAGLPERVRPCISCNQLCWGRRSRDYWISCLVNPSAGREWQWHGDRPEPAAVPGSVLVVGGGPAGLEAARVAAERGHRVTLVEAGDGLGGQFRLAGRQPTRGQILDLLAWYARELDRLGVDVRLSTPVTADDVRRLAVELGAQEVVLATGSLPPRTGWQRPLPLVEVLPGVEAGLAAGTVLAVQDVLAEPPPAVGERVVLLDDVGDWRGLGTALHLAEAGHRVTLVTSAAAAGAALGHSAVDGLLRGRFARAGGAVLPSSVVTGWRGDRAEVRSLPTGETVEVRADTLVLAETPQPRTELADVLLAPGAWPDGPAVHLVGDCVAGRRAWLAIYEARDLAQRL
jgi:2,4-dienoyl-CoA reductase-like NADH-dependent reductase (Old Yellow Enzyme family)